MTQVLTILAAIFFIIPFLIGLGLAFYLRAKKIVINKFVLKITIIVIIGIILGVICIVLAAVL